MRAWGFEDMRGRILAVAEVTAAGLIAGEDGRRYGYGLTDLRSAAPRAGDTVDFRVDAGPVDPSREVASARDVSLAPSVPTVPAVPLRTDPLRTDPKPDWMNFYLSPGGRVSLGDYWLYGFLVLFAVNLLIGWIPILGQIVSLVAAWAGIALAIKRCHDVNRSGWWAWLPGLPLVAAIAAIPLAMTGANDAAIAVVAACGVACLVAAAWVFFAILIRRGDVEANRFGAPPAPIKP